MAMRSRRSDRPRVGISACLLGDKVRYDGSDKRDAYLVEVLGQQVEWVRVCPEVEAGMGTPRETLHLVRDDGRVRPHGRVRARPLAMLRMGRSRSAPHLGGMRVPRSPVMLKGCAW